MIMKGKMEHDEILIGTGTTTKVPVRLSIKHGSVVLSGMSGCGKTFALKLITKRFAQKHSTASVFVIDVFDEYNDIAKDSGLNIISINNNVTELDNRSIIITNQSLKRDKHTDLIVDILEHIWNLINKMPQDRLKLVVLDEAQIVNITLRGKIVIDKFQRLGKEFNVLFLTSIQHTKRIDSDLVDAFGTKIYMPQFITIPFELTINEEFVPRNEQKQKQLPTPYGYGLLSNNDQRIHFHFE